MLGFVLGVVAFQGHGLLAFVVLVGYIVVDAARYMRVDE